MPRRRGAHFEKVLRKDEKMSHQSFWQRDKNGLEIFEALNFNFEMLISSFKCLVLTLKSTISSCKCSIRHLKGEFQVFGHLKCKFPDNKIITIKY